MEGVSAKPAITAEEAKGAFARYKEIPVEEVTDFKADLLIKEISSISGIETVYSTALVYRIYLITGHPDNDELGYIDAHSGKVLLTEPSMTGFSAIGTFETLYNGSKQASTQYYNNTYNLCDSSRNAVIHTRDLNGSTNINSAVEFTDTDNSWTATEYHSNEDDMGLDIHWALQEIYDYFKEQYSINSFDDGINQGEDINAYFHFGIKDFAGWNFVENLLVYGDGNTLYTPVASLDAVAHEYGHGITDFQIGWGSTGDPYAFNEGMSDIWAIISENRVSPNSIWEIGEEIILNYDCLRNIQDPDDSNAKTEISGTYLSTKYNDNSVPGDVPYIKGGVFSHWFYLLVNGGTDTNDNNDDYTVYGIGMDAAEELVVEAVFNNYLDNTTTYPQIRTAMVSAANSLFGTNSFHVCQVEAAWYAVGVGTQPTQTTVTGSDLICNSGSIITANNSPTGSSISWATSTNLKVDSGQGTTTPTIKPKYSSSNGAGWVQANYTTGPYIADGPRNNVWVGKPQVYSLMNHLVDIYTGMPMYDFCYGTANECEAVHPAGDAGITAWDWRVTGGTVYPYGSQYKYATIYPNSYSNFMVEIRAFNGCNEWTDWARMYTNVVDCYGYYMVLSPNPTSGETTLSIESTSEEKTFDETADWELEVYSPSQTLKEKKTKLKGKEHKIQTQGWQEGVYVVRVKYKNEVLTGKLVVKK